MSIDDIDVVSFNSDMTDVIESKYSDSTKFNIVVSAGIFFDMLKNLGGTWYVYYSDYCKMYYNKNKKVICYGCPLSSNNSDVNMCCNGLFSVMKASKTVLEFKKNLSSFVSYISKKRGLVPEEIVEEKTLELKL